MPDSKQTSRRVALFAGSFDPITNGHVDVVGKAVRLAERLVIAVGIHPGKTPLFSADDRLAMIDEVCAPLARAAGCELSVVTFADLVVTAAQRAGATMLVRGVRDATDFDYEMQRPWRRRFKPYSCPPPPPCAPSLPLWCARLRAWGATFRALSRLRSQHG